jgi:hypothetical protein
MTAEDASEFMAAVEREVAALALKRERLEMGAAFPTGYTGDEDATLRNVHIPDAESKLAAGTVYELRCSVGDPPWVPHGAAWYWRSDMPQGGDVATFLHPFARHVKMNGYGLIGRLRVGDPVPELSEDVEAARV